VLQAAALAESGQVYVMDMGEPVKIIELARTMIHLAGHREDEIGIVFSGLRPGRSCMRSCWRMRTTRCVCAPTVADCTTGHDRD